MANSGGKLVEFLEAVKFKQEYKVNLITPIETFLKQSLSKDIGSCCIFIRPNGDCSDRLVSNTCCYFLKKKSYRKYIFISLDCVMHRNQNTIIREIARLVYEDDEYTEFQKQLYSEQLVSLSDYLKTVIKKVIMVITNIDRLLLETNQTLIYTLFDATRYNSNFIFIGDTTRLNVVEMMEKRVKSRFSHQIYILNGSFGAEQFLNYLKNIVSNTLNNNYNEFLDQLSSSILLQDTSYRQLNNLSVSNFCRLVQFSNKQSNPSEFFKKFHLNCIQSSDTKILAGLSNFELVIVLLAAKISIQKSSSCYFTSLLLYSDFKDFIDRTNYRVFDVDLFIFNKTIKDLCCYGILLRQTKKHQRYQLSIDPYEIVDHVKKATHLPQDIRSIVYNS